MELNDIQKRVLTRIVQKSQLHSKESVQAARLKAKKNKAYIYVTENGRRKKILHPAFAGYNNYAHLVTLYEKDFPDIDFSNDIRVVLDLFKKEKAISDFALICEDSKRLYELDISDKLDGFAKKYLMSETQKVRATNRLDQAMEKLSFSPNDGVAVYKTAHARFTRRQKGYELLNYFFEYSNQNIECSLKEIMDSSNDRIRVTEHRFHKEKDINDTLRNIRKKLKVNKSESFPLCPTGNGWILHHR